MKLTAARIATPLGDVFAVVDPNGALNRLDFVGSKERAADEAELERRLERRGHTVTWNERAVEHVAKQLRDYFAGRRQAFELAVAPEGTAFQQAVWKELAGIPCGETESYASLARKVGRPHAARAVGRANATNPISLVLPCHRVVGRDGSLTGYAGGIERKRALLDLEGAEVEAGANP